MSSVAKDRRPSTRGDAARERLLASAVELFGRCGYEGVGARELTTAAAVPLSALPYYFGTKETLYRAAVARVLARLAVALAPAVAQAAVALTDEPARAAEALIAFQGALLDALAVAPEAAGWAKLLLREHLDPGPAFDLVYDDAGRGAVEMMAALIAHAGGRASDDEAVLIEAFARLGEVLVFRTVQAAVVRRLGWERLGEEQARRVRGVIASLHQRVAKCGPKG